MRQFQGGFSLFELIVVIAITSLIGVWSATTWVHQSEDVASEAMGSWLMTVKASVDQMLVRQADLLTGLSASTTASADYQDIWRPTLAELQRAGHLPSGFSLRAPLGYDVSIRALKPTGLCLTLGCKLEVLTVVVPQASQANRAENVTRLGTLLASFKGSGASVSQLSPGRVRGPSIDLPNPPAIDLPSLPVGSIVLYSFYDSSAQVSFLRQGDRRDVQLAANMSLAGNLATGGNISSAGRISSSAHLQLGAVAIQGAPCDAAGLLAQSSASGLLICQAGAWRSSAKSEGGFYIDRVGFGCDQHDGIRVERRNPMTGDCSCPPGYRAQLASFWTYPRDSHNDFYTYICLNSEG
ncbi:MAG: shufflon system plasmid conjugative transfer pilus tip adhesin PilV [Burkholderiaceae bacterium]|nr:shufflon system plasmid conjugative transfer pilus tip adhesin PilV [Burkholderiaceae bacterium]